MNALKSLFAPKMIRLKIGDRVKDKITGTIATVVGTSTIRNGAITVPAINVRYDDGVISDQIAENQFHKLGENVNLIYGRKQ